MFPPLHFLSWTSILCLSNVFLGGGARMVPLFVHGNLRSSSAWLLFSLVWSGFIKCNHMIFWGSINWQGNAYFHSPIFLMRTGNKKKLIRKFQGWETKDSSSRNGHGPVNSSSSPEARTEFWFPVPYYLSAKGAILPWPCHEWANGLIILHAFPNFLHQSFKKSLD